MLRAWLLLSFLCVFIMEGAINGPRDRRFPKKEAREHRINEEIRSSSVRLVGDGEPKIIATDQALRIAQEQGLDLVEITPNQEPPIVKVMGYSKFRFEQIKKQKEAKKKQHVVHIKEVKIRPGIDDHDYAHKVRHAKDFLEAGDKVKFTMMFRGREIVHSELGMVVLKKILAELESCSVVEKTPSIEGRNMSMILAPAALFVKARKEDTSNDNDVEE
jgi:translation initiation factor IF-3